ncbi:MAG TPA: TonB-dependent receptor [Pyrinomonadaceae bacterium]|nr:TonB-dependent receptor [Pyrinomonadaceae bacterium]
MTIVARISTALCLAACSLLLCGAAGAARQAEGSLRGQVKDPHGAVVAAASVRLVDAAGRERQTATNREGVYLFERLEPGRYRLLVSAEGFGLFENNEVVVAAGRRETLDLSLAITVEETVNVGEAGGVSVDPDNNANSLVLRGRDLDFLPDDPDALASVLQAFAGAAAGPDGVEILVDGFSGVRTLPRRGQISEIRINQNPFTAEYDRIGFGRIDLRLNPTTEKFHGNVEFYFNDESLNSRNPFAANRAPFQVRNYAGQFSGPLIRNRASFYAAVAREETDGNSVVNATVLDAQLRPTPFGLAVLVPERELYSDVRTDFKLNAGSNLTLNYQYLPDKQFAAGVGGFNLPSRAYDVLNRTHIARALLSSVVSPRTFNQLRFQFLWNLNRVRNAGTDPTVNVLEAFTGGGANVNGDRTDSKRYELQNNVTYGLGNRTLRFGGRLRAVRIAEFSPLNFNGTYTFAGGRAPALDQDGRVIVGPGGQPLLVDIDSLERYRRTLFFRGLGLTPAEIRARGGGATQFSIAAGDPEAEVSQYDVGLYAQYDWRLGPTFNLGLGLRYENQSNISSHLNFAPRVSFAWAPGATDKARPKAVVRGGFGVFYLRFNEQLTLQAERFNGVGRQQFIVSDPAVLDLFPAVPPASALEALNLPQTTRVTESGLRAPYSYQAALSVERQLPRNTTFSATLVSARYIHLLRSRNVNAPLPGTFDPGDPDGGVRPLPGGNLFQFESSGWLNQTQLILNFNSRLNPKLSVYSNYTLNRSRADTNGASWFPADSYDLGGEYGRSSLDVRQRFTAGGNYEGPWGLIFNPLVVARSGLPFNITTGRDANGDALFTERPAFAASASGPDTVATRYGLFDPTPEPGQRLIPLNYGTGPAFFAVNLRVTKNYSFGSAPLVQGAQGQPAKKGEKPYTLTTSVSFQNLFNRNNPAVPIGNLSSPLFGQSNASATEAGAASPNNNRRINFSVRLSF